MKMVKLPFLILIMVLLYFDTASAQVPPTLISPSNGNNCVKKFALLEWSPVTNAVSYKLEVADNPDFFTPIVFMSNLTTTSTSVALPEWNKLYYWRATSVFDNNNTGVSTTWTFTTKFEPLKLVSPAHESGCMDTLVTFKWRKADAEFYHLQVAEDLDFDTIIFTKNNITDTSFSVRLPLYAKQYFWRVASKKSLCETEFSEIWSLTTKQKFPNLISPANGSKGGSIFTTAPFEINLLWRKSGAAHTYDVQVSKKADFSETILNVTNTSDSSVTLSLANSYDTTYYWRVRNTYNGCSSYWTDVQTFKTPYNKPVPNDPVNNETCVTMDNTLFKWVAVTGVTRYRLQVSDTVSFSRLLIDSAGINDRQIILNLNNPLKVHYWRVRADDNLNSGLWSDTRNFTTTQKGPVNLVPNDNAIGLRKSVDFTWNKYGVGEKFDLKIYANSDLTVVLVDTTALDTNYFHFVLPNDNATYYWKVRAKFGTCYGDWSKVHKFKTLIPAPQPLTPANNSVNVSLNPVFTWNVVEDAVTYEFEISKNSDMSKRLLLERGITATTFTYPALNYNEKTKYYWRIRSVNADGISLWSETFSFTTAEFPPDKPILVSPVNNASKVSRNPILKWEWSQQSNPEKTVSFIVTVASDLNFENIFVNQEVNAKELEVVGLERFTSYWWKVTAKATDGQTTTTEPFIFKTEDIAPTVSSVLLVPEDKAKDLGLILSFRWSGVERALAYKLQIADNSNFSESSIKIEHLSVKDTHRTVSGLEYNKKYYWRVAAWNEAGDAPWSAIREFNTSVNASVRNEDVNINSHSVSPNPSINLAIINLDAKNSSVSTLQITDLTGNVILENKNLFINEGQNNIQVDVSNFANGIYFYTIKSATGILSGKLIKE